VAEPQLKFLLGAVVHNEGPRLPAWLAHWQAISDNIVVIDQASTDDTAEAIAAAGIAQAFRTPVAHWCEPDRNHLFKFLRHPQEPVLVMDADEYMTYEHVILCLAEMEAHPAINTWFLRRQNMVDGVDCQAAFISPQDPFGFDWQLRLCRGMTLRWSAPHRYPDSNGMVGYIDPEVVWIDHRRTYEMIKARNCARPGATPAILQMQAGFVERVDAVLKQKKGGN